uniref:RING-type domain-containing protein n=1 Tax=Panagrolaimus sp. JU765 TaxID=591449 RepID=A0AC34QWI1_9BILA
MPSIESRMSRKRKHQSKKGKKLIKNIKNEKLPEIDYGYECQICKMILTTGNTCVLKCGHVYHIDCINQGFSSLQCRDSKCQNSAVVCFWPIRCAYFEQFGMKIDPVKPLEKFPNFGSFKENVMCQIFRDHPMHELEKEKPIILFKKAKNYQNTFQVFFQKNKDLSRAYFQLRRTLHFCDAITLSPEYEPFYRQHEMVWREFNHRIDNQFAVLEQYIHSLFYTRFAAEFNFFNSIKNTFEKYEKFLFGDAPKDIFRHSV